MSEPADLNAPDSASLVDHLLWQIRGGYAHDSLAAIADRIDESQVGWVPPGLSHSAWQIVEHLRICQRDLIDFTRTPAHVSPKFPDGLWPDQPQPSPGRWADSLARFESDRAEFIGLISAGDVLASQNGIAAATPLRQTLIAVTHLSYHVGQLSLYPPLLARR